MRRADTAKNGRPPVDEAVFRGAGAVGSLFGASAVLSVLRACGPAVLILALESPSTSWAAPADAPPAVGEPIREKVAAPPSNRFDLHYAAPSECPSRQEFITWTNQFYVGTDESAEPGNAPSSGAWQASPGELAGSVQVKVVGDGTRYTAHLLMVDAAGQCPTSRPPHTETVCADAVRAMAYSLAQALKAPPCADTADARQHPNAPPSPPPKPKPQACPAHRPCPPRDKTIRGELGWAAGIVNPLADDVAWGGALLAGFTTRTGSPSARLAVGYWNAGTVPVGHALRAQLWSLGASACPFRLNLSPWLALPLCATAEVGSVALSGVGSAAADTTAASATASESEDRANLYLWSSLGVAARLRMESHWLFVEIEPNLVFPLLHYPVYVHQPGSEASERQDAGQVGRWLALKAHLNAGIIFP